MKAKPVLRSQTGVQSGPTPPIYEVFVYGRGRVCVTFSKREAYAEYGNHLFKIKRKAQHDQATNDAGYVVLLCDGEVRREYLCSVSSGVNAVVSQERRVERIERSLEVAKEKLLHLRRAIGLKC